MLLPRFTAMAASGLAIAFAMGPVRLLAQGKPVDVKADSKFIHEVTSDNLMEIRLGRLAEKRASNAEVKQFGQRMVTDHTKLQDQWRTMASKNGLAFKPSLGRLHQQKETRLDRVSRSEFDRAYMTTMIQQHKDDVDYFQNEGRAAHSGAVRELVSSSLPVLEQDLTLAKQVGSKVSADTTAASRPRHVTAARTK